MPLRIREQAMQLSLKYHRNAARTLASAAAAKSPQARNAFLAISMGWEALASDIEQAAAGAKRTVTAKSRSGSGPSRNRT